MFQKVGNGIVLLGGAQGEWSLSEARELRDSLNEAILDLESGPTPDAAETPIGYCKHGVNLGNQACSVCDPDNPAFR